MKEWRDARRTILLSLYVLIIAAVFSFFLRVIPPNQARTSAFPRPFASVSIDMNVVVTNPKNLSRVMNGYYVWGKDFVHLFPNSSYTMLSSRDFTKYTSRARTTDYIPQYEEYQNYVFSFSESLLSFYLNPTKMWYVRTTEDCFIDLRKLAVFFEELESKYDPTKDFLMFGQLCRIDNDYAFIHGGTGWVMSRKAVMDVQPLMGQFLTEFFSLDSGDDTITNLIRIHFNLSDSQMHSSLFLGTKMDNWSVEVIQKRNYSSILPCSKYQIEDTLSRKPIQLNKVLFWHSGRSDSFPMNDGYNVIDSTPDYVHVIFLEHYSRICYGDAR